MLESSINEQLGNLYRKGVTCASGKPYESSLCNWLSLKKDDLYAWLEGDSTELCVLVEEVAIGAGSSMGIENEHVGAIQDISNLSMRAKTTAKVAAKKSRKTKKEIESLVTIKCCAAEQKSTVTRSKKTVSHANRVSCVKSAENFKNSSNCQTESGVPTVSNRIICQKCFSKEATQFGSLSCFIQMKWEFVRRRQILRLLIGLGKVQFHVL